LIITDGAIPELNGLDMMLTLARQFLDVKVIAISDAGGDTDVLDRAALRYELEH
jgi:response regulator of citrate/malate metabolism